MLGNSPRGDLRFRLDNRFLEVGSIEMPKPAPFSNSTLSNNTLLPSTSTSVETWPPLVAKHNMALLILSAAAVRNKWLISGLSKDQLSFAFPQLFQKSFQHIPRWAFLAGALLTWRAWVTDAKAQAPLALCCQASISPSSAKRLVKTKRVARAARSVPRGALIQFPYTNKRPHSGEWWEVMGSQGKWKGGGVGAQHYRHELHRSDIISSHCEPYWVPNIVWHIVFCFISIKIFIFRLKCNKV